MNGEKKRVKISKSRLLNQTHTNTFTYTPARSRYPYVYRRRYTKDSWFVGRAVFLSSSLFFLSSSHLLFIIFFFVWSFVVPTSRSQLIPSIELCCQLHDTHTSTFTLTTHIHSNILLLHGQQKAHANEQTRTIKKNAENI